MVADVTRELGVGGRGASRPFRIYKDDEEVGQSASVLLSVTRAREVHLATAHGLGLQLMAPNSSPWLRIAAHGDSTAEGKAGLAGEARASCEWQQLWLYFFRSTTHSQWESPRTIFLVSLKEKFGFRLSVAPSPHL